VLLELSRILEEVKFEGNETPVAFAGFPISKLVPESIVSVPEEVPAI